MPSYISLYKIRFDHLILKFYLYASPHFYFSIQGNLGLQLKWVRLSLHVTRTKIKLININPNLNLIQYMIENVKLERRTFLFF